MVVIACDTVLKIRITLEIEELQMHQFVLSGVDLYNVDLEEYSCF